MQAAGSTLGPAPFVLMKSVDFVIGFLCGGPLVDFGERLKVSSQSLLR